MANELIGKIKRERDTAMMAAGKLLEVFNEHKDPDVKFVCAGLATVLSIQDTTLAALEALLIQADFPSGGGTGGERGSGQSRDDDRSTEVEEG